MNNIINKSRKDKALETKRHLHATADALFTQYGFDSVSVDRIVEEAGLSKGTFYVHFQTKDDLLVSLISDYVEKVDMDYQAFIDTFASDVPATDILLQLVDKIMDVIIDSIGLEKMKILYRTQLANNTNTRAAASYQRMLYTTIIDVLERGLNNKEFMTGMTSQELANHLMLTMRGLTYEWCIRYPDFDLKTQARIHFDLLLKGMQTESK